MLLLQDVSVSPFAIWAASQAKLESESSEQEHFSSDAKEVSCPMLISLCTQRSVTSVGASCAARELAWDCSVLTVPGREIAC